MPQTVDATAVSGRAEALRAPIVEAGRKYPGLARVAGLMIRLGALIRILSFVGGSYQAVRVFLTLRGLLGPVPVAPFPGIAAQPQYPLAAALMDAAFAGVLVLAGGLIVWLVLTAIGELMYLAVDVEEAIRHRGQ